MKKQVFLSLYAAILILSGCGIFKNRTVHVDNMDSLSKSEETSKVKESSSHIDTGTIKTIGTVKTITTVHETDSATTETHITPTPGKPFTMDLDGTFHGEAQFVDTKTTKSHTKNKTKQNTTNTQVDEKKGGSDHTKNDSSGSKKQETHLQKKTKDVVATPDYGWIWIVAAIIALCLAAYSISRKLF